MRALKNDTPQLRTAVQWLAPFLVMGFIVSCLDNKATVEVTGYDHMEKRAILWFTVNGASGPNLFPESGGGKYNCCIEIPKRWHRGMKATVRWQYGTGDDSPREAVVDIPEYTSENRGPVQVHVYDNHRVKVVVSRYSLGHPMYPLPKDDWSPWELNEDWAHNYYEDQKKQ
ncbi:hypothetical protein LMG19087_01313 [Ralstonia wenshanensis]|uniref:DUF3304 domain-containing protein n=1 Tax=Ralstonia wenshanensis TaxID=2842456 RepID=UPI0028F5A207|nr:DUF3304 domain-containing protein [Ralstonia wenshanensis]CAJ0812068.1 hypothetical protein LMG19087_01313 [Ralstonia wenshanensis]